MKRRDFIKVIAGSATVWPLAARTQQPGQPRRIGLLMLYPAKDPPGELRARVFQHELEKAGWIVGGNLQINFHWGTGDADWVRSAIVQILGQSPDVMLANGDAAVKAHSSQPEPFPSLAAIRSEMA